MPLHGAIKCRRKGSLTPTKQQLEEKALELWRSDQVRSGCMELAETNPEYEELIEGGYVALAQNLLMRNDSTYKDYLESELGQNVEDYRNEVKPFDFDVEEGKRTGTMIIGGRGTGKSNLAKIIAEQYMEGGSVVKVFDVSRTWLESSIPSYVEVTQNTAYLDIELYESVVFDLSRLYPKQVKNFVTQIIAKEFEIQVNTPKNMRNWIIYVFEDSAVSLPRNRLTSREGEELLRLMSVGRNYDLGYLAIVQRPSLTDVTAFELSFQKYFGRLDGENDKRKIRSYIGKDYVDMLDSLEIGEFLYDKGDSTKKISTPLFSSDLKPRRLETPSRLTPQQAQATTEIDTLAGIAIAILSLIGLTSIVQSVLM